MLTKSFLQSVSTVFKYKNWAISSKPCQCVTLSHSCRQPLPTLEKPRHQILVFHDSSPPKVGVLRNHPSPPREWCISCQPGSNSKGGDVPAGRGFPRTLPVCGRCEPSSSSSSSPSLRYRPRNLGDALVSIAIQWYRGQMTAERLAGGGGTTFLV